MGIFAPAGAPAAFFAGNGGKVYGFNNIGGANVPILAKNPQRVSITFHNPGPGDVLVFPTITGTGAPNTPSNAGGSGGAFLIFANGGTLVISGECQLAWSCFARSGAGNMLTVMESNVP